METVYNSKIPIISILIPTFSAVFNCKEEQEWNARSIFTLLSILWPHPARHEVGYRAINELALLWATCVWHSCLSTAVVCFHVGPEMRITPVTTCLKPCCSSPTPHNYFLLRFATLPGHRRYRGRQPRTDRINPLLSLLQLGGSSLQITDYFMFDDRDNAQSIFFHHLYHHVSAIFGDR